MGPLNSLFTQIAEIFPICMMYSMQKLYFQPFNNWLDGAKEDLMDIFIVHTIEEIDVSKLKKKIVK